jgi:hypothetical protein
MVFSANRDDSLVEALGRALMRRRSCGIFASEKAREVSGCAGARGRSKPGVFAFGGAFR